MKTAYYLILEIIILFGKHKVLMTERTNPTFVNITYSWHIHILSTKPIPGICFAHNHCAGHLIWININYSWHTIYQQNLFLELRSQLLCWLLHKVRHNLFLAYNITAKTQSDRDIQKSICYGLITNSFL